MRINPKGLLTVIAMTMVTLTYQQCAPAKFSAEPTPVNKSETTEGGLATNVPVVAPPAGPAKQPPTEPGKVPVKVPTKDPEKECKKEPVKVPTPVKEACIDKSKLIVENKDGIPTVLCPKDSSQKCVVVCHVPPGNPSAAHTIIIGASALQAHLNHGSQGANKSTSSKDGAKHGDYLGECKPGVVPAPVKVCETK